MRELSDISNHGPVFPNMDSLAKDYRKLSELPTGSPLRVVGAFINNKSKFGPAPVIGIENVGFVDCPKGALSKVQKLIEKPEYVDLINEGKIFIETYTYVSKTYNKTCYDFKVEVED